MARKLLRKVQYFDKEEFSKTVELWLEDKKQLEKKPYYQFLAMVSLINLIPLIGKDLTTLWNKDNLRHSYALYRTPLILAFVDDPASIDYAAALYAAVSKAALFNPEIKLHGIGEAAFAANSKDIASSASSASSAFLDACLVNSEIRYVHNFITLLWLIRVKKIVQGTMYREYYAYLEEFKPLIIEAIKPLLNIGLEYLYEDLLILIENLFENGTEKVIDENFESQKIDDSRIESYSKKLDLSAFVSKELLQKALFGKTDTAQVRVLIVGSGGSGKTSLFQLLSAKMVLDNASTTEINRHIISNCTIRWGIENPFDHKVDLSIWDFAGQTQYYGLHRSFFSNRCLYVLVIDSRHQQSPYDWLEQISLISGEQGAHVLILINNYESCSSQLNIADIQSRFSNLNISTDSIFEVNLGSFKNLNIRSKDTEDEGRLIPFLRALIKTSEMVQTYMDIETLGFYRDINSKIDSNKYYFEGWELEDIAEQHNRTDNYKELLRAFGSLVETEQDDYNYWLSAKWLNEKGYKLLHNLQSSKPQNYYKINEIIRKVNKNLVSEIPLDAYRVLLKSFYQSAIAVAIDGKIIFPALLSANDPEFLNELNNTKRYSLYASFEIRIDFMQMGLFSQWLAEWLSESQKRGNLELIDGHYSRYCCILSSANNTQLSIKWHPHYRVLIFSLYYPITTSSIDDNHLNSFSEMLHSALTTVFSKQRIHSIQNTLIMGEKYQINEDMTKVFIKELNSINQKGIIYHYFMHSANKGNINVENINNAHNQTIIGTNSGTTQTANTINNLNINNSQQEDFLEALDKLEKKYRQNNHSEPVKVENFAKVIDSAKSDIQTGELDKDKKGLLEKIVQGIDSANPIMEYVLGLFTIYGTVAGLI